MGNRAVLTSKYNFENNGVGCYVHWNGGIESVYAFLQYCKAKEYRDPAYDDYGWARLAQVIGNFFCGTTSVGINTVDRLDCDNYDNGTYIIEGWKIIDRKYSPYDDKLVPEYKGDEFFERLLDIDSYMPSNEQLGEYKLRKFISENCYQF